MNDLTEEQMELLSSMVEAERRLPKGKRHEFSLIPEHGRFTLAHPGFPNKDIQIHLPDLDWLFKNYFVNKSREDQYGTALYVTPLGIKKYGLLKRLRTEPVENIERSIQKRLGSENFHNRNPIVQSCLERAEKSLWISTTKSEFTSIGHSCRDALQEFANSALTRSKATSYDPDISHFVNRLKTVLDSIDSHIGKTDKVYCNSLLTFLKDGVTPLVQRLEHGVQKKGEEVKFNDARRVVFAVMYLIYELDSMFELARI